MNTTRVLHFGILTSVGIAAAACSGGGTTAGPSKTTTGTTTTAGGNTTATATTAGGTNGFNTTGTTAGTTASATTTTGATAGTTGTSGGTGACNITPDITGWVDKSQTGTCAIQGAFYPYGDGLGSTGTPPGDCQNAGFTTSQCSTISSMIPAAGTICASGTGAMVIPCAGTAGQCAGMMGMPAYSAIWGAGIGVDLNNSGGDAAVKSPYDATAHGVTGVSFDIDTVPAGGIRVEFPAVGQETKARYVTILLAGHQEAKFADATVGYDTTDTALVNTSAVNSFQWHVPTQTAATVPYMFCLSNFGVTM